MSDVFEAVGLRRDFGRKRVLRGVDLDLAPGECTVLLGRNGEGKSTLLRLALGVLRPTAGALRVAGADPTRAPDEVRRRVGYVPDTPDGFAWMTLAELLRFAGAHYPTWSPARAQDLAARFAVPLDTRLRALSRGQGMKAMLVLALASEPRLLLLDEPFAGLDPVVRDEVLQVVVSSLREEGRTVLCATHELEVAARIADRVAVLEGGRIVAHGSLAEVLGEDEPGAVPQKLRRIMAACAEGEGVRC
ncbi:MAG: ABC transporter ATP-binding protein [Planctomycetota bacterium]